MVEAVDKDINTIIDKLVARNMRVGSSVSKKLPIEISEKLLFGISEKLLFDISKKLVCDISEELLFDKHKNKPSSEQNKTRLMEILPIGKTECGSQRKTNERE